MKLKQYIEKLNNYISNNNTIQEEWYDDWMDQFPIEILPEEIDCKLVWQSTVDEHRWYGLQYLVFELSLDDEIVYIKNTFVTQSYSEMQSLGDIYHSYKQFEIVTPKEVTTVIYV